MLRVFLHNFININSEEYIEKMTLVTTEGLDVILEAALDAFDGMMYMAWGTGTTADSIADTTLETEGFRNLFNTTSVKNIGAGTYLFEGRIPLPQFNGLTISEVGIFDSASNGIMGARELFSPTFVKTDDDEIIVQMQILVEVANT